MGKQLQGRDGLACDTVDTVEGMKVEELAARTRGALLAGDEGSKAALDAARNLSLRDAEPVAAMLLNNTEALAGLEAIIRDPTALLHHETLHWLSYWYTSRSNKKDDGTVLANNSSIGLLFLSVV